MFFHLHFAQVLVRVCVQFGVADLCAWFEVHAVHVYGECVSCANLVNKFGQAVHLLVVYVLLEGQEAVLEDAFLVGHQRVKVFRGRQYDTSQTLLVVDSVLFGG